VSKNVRDCEQRISMQQRGHVVICTSEFITSSCGEDSGFDAVDSVLSGSECGTGPGDGTGSIHGSSASVWRTAIRAWWRRGSLSVRGGGFERIENCDGSARVWVCERGAGTNQCRAAKAVPDEVDVRVVDRACPAPQVDRPSTRDLEGTLEHLPFIEERDRVQRLVQLAAAELELVCAQPEGHLRVVSTRRPPVRIGGRRTIRPDDLRGRDVTERAAHAIVHARERRCAGAVAVLECEYDAPSRREVHAQCRICRRGPSQAVREEDERPRFAIRGA
jgi:hypothetical protein